VDPNDPDGERYVRAIVGTIEPHTLEDENSVYQAILQVNQMHIQALRKAAEECFIHWRTHYQHGQALLKLATSDVSDDFRQGKLSHWQSISLYRKYFPLNDSQSATANFLRLCIDCFGGQVPSETNVGAWRSRFQKLVRRLGGRHYLDAMLTAHRSAVGTAALLYIIDAGANVSPALALSIDFELPSDDPGFVFIHTTKDRADYAPLYDLLPVHDGSVRVTAVEALRAIREMTSARRQAFPSLGNNLLVFSYFSVPSIANDAFLRNQMSYLLRKSDLPSTWVPSAIRHSVAMDAVKKTSGTLEPVARLLNHKELGATVNGYAFTYPIRRLLELRIRHFQELLQAAFASNVAGAMPMIGYSASQSRHLVKTAEKTGLGFLCARQHNQSQTAERDSTSCTKIGTCPGCEHRLFIVNSESLAEICAVHRVLSQKQTELEATSRSRWQSVWADLLAFSIAVLEVAKTSPYAYLIPKAQNRAIHMIENGFDPTLIRP
jgi:hypothetical protein